MRSVLGYYFGDNPSPARRPANPNVPLYTWVPVVLSVALWTGIAYFLVSHRHEIECCIRSLGL